MCIRDSHLAGQGVLHRAQNAPAGVGGLGNGIHLPALSLHHGCLLYTSILTGQDPEKVENKEVHINEYGTDDYSRLALTYPGGCKAESTQTDRKSTRLNSSHITRSRMPSSA